MFTSRAEYRLQLREDNADARLTPTGFELGLVDAPRWLAFNAKMQAISDESSRLQALWVVPGNAMAKALERASGISVSRDSSALDLLKRPEITYASLTAVAEFGPASASQKVAEQVEISVKYSGYLIRQNDDIAKQKKNENTAIPDSFEFDGIPGLSKELQGKLSKIRPETIGQAQRIPGMTPAAISLLLIQLTKRRRAA
jgi:tRNA uridine 5-carboxymethylaminomethyl modification enzyme